MNNKLLTAVFTAAVSSITNAAQTPNYDKLPIDQKQFCEKYGTKSCQKIATLLAAAEEFTNEHGVFWTEETIQKRAKYAQKIAQEIQEKHKEITIKIEDDAEKTGERVEAIIQKLTDENPAE